MEAHQSDSSKPNNNNNKWMNFDGGPIQIVNMNFSVAIAANHRNHSGRLWFEFPHKLTHLDEKLKVEMREWIERNGGTAAPYMGKCLAILETNLVWACLCSPPFYRHQGNDDDKELGRLG
jgi:hypothetical protein